MFCWRDLNENPLLNVTSNALLQTVDKLYIDQHRFQIDVSDAPVFKLGDAMSPVYYFESMFRPEAKEQPQWEDYLWSKLSPQLSDQLKRICPDIGMWSAVELSHQGTFRSDDEALHMANDFDFVYVFLKFLRTSRSMMDHPKSCDSGMGAFAHHTLALVVSELFTWDVASCKEHIYDRLVFELYSYGRSSFLQLNPGREKDAVYDKTIKLRLHRRGKDRIQFYASLPTRKLYEMGYFCVQDFPMRADYAAEVKASNACKRLVAMTSWMRIGSQGV
jgi:hypothetical protein